MTSRLSGLFLALAAEKIHEFDRESSSLYKLRQQWAGDWVDSFAVRPLWRLVWTAVLVYRLPLTRLLSAYATCSTQFVGAVVQK